MKDVNRNTFDLLSPPSSPFSAHPAKYNYSGLSLDGTSGKFHSLAVVFKGTLNTNFKS